MLCCSLPTFWHYLISKEKHALGLCMSRFLCFTSPKNDSWFHITCLFDLRLLPCSYLALVSTNDLWDLYPALLANKSKASHLLKYCIAIVFQVNWDSPRHCKSFYRGSQVWQIAGNNRSFIFGSMTVQIHSQMLKKNPLHLDSVITFLWKSDWDIVCAALQMFRGMIWIYNIFTWHRGNSWWDAVTQWHF